jgi:hypothetical protein
MHPLQCFIYTCTGFASSALNDIEDALRPLLPVPPVMAFNSLSIILLLPSTLTADRDCLLHSFEACYL